MKKQSKKRENKSGMREVAQRLVRVQRLCRQFGVAVPMRLPPKHKA